MTGDTAEGEASTEEEAPSADVAPFNLDTDDAGVEATERLQAEFPAEDFADPEDQAEILRVTEGVAPEQTAVALDHVLKGLAGNGEVDCEALAKEIGTTPERAYEMALRLVDAHTRLIAARLFDGNQALHAEFVQWALKNDRAAYVKASEAVARTQSSKPMAALVQRRIAALRADEAKQSKQQAQQPARREAPSKAEAGDGITAMFRRMDEDLRRMDREFRNRPYEWE